MIILLQSVVEISESTPIKDFFYNEYIIEIFGSILFSLMGLALIWFLRPKVKISTQIARTTDDDGNVKHTIKIINKSYLFQLIDISMELSLLKPVSSPKGMNLAIKKIPLKSDHLWFLSRRKMFTSSTDFATYALVATLEDIDLRNVWKNTNGAFLDLKVIAKNNFSGITGINHEKYNHFSCIKDGEFCHGNSLDIENGQ